MPVYNKAAWLPSVLDSIRRQSGDFDREYIFVDDGSTDGSADILRAATLDWPKITLVFQSNHGAAHANNRALELVSMPYVKFIDADDLLIENATALLLYNLQANPSACLAYGRAGTYATLDGVEFGLPVLPAGVVRLIEEPLIRVMHSGWFNPSQMLVRADCIRAVGGSDERIRHAQDYTLLLRLAARWPFLEVPARIAFLQTADPTRLTANRAEQQEEATLALAGFLADHPAVDSTIKLYACRRAAKRAALFARRMHRYRQAIAFRVNWASTYLPGGVRDAVTFILGCAGVFRKQILGSQSYFGPTEVATPPKTAAVVPLFVEAKHPGSSPIPEPPGRPIL